MDCCSTSAIRNTACNKKSKIMAVTKSLQRVLRPARQNSNGSESAGNRGEGDNIDWEWTGWLAENRGEFMDTGEAGHT